MNIPVRLFFFLFFLIGCTETYFAATTFTTPDGTELTEDSCTEEFIDFLDLSEEFHLLEAEDIQLLSRSEIPDDLSEYNQLTKEGNTLVEEYNDSLKTTNSENWIRNVKDRINVVKDRLSLSRKRVYSKEKFDRLLRKAKKLQWENEILLADSYKFSADLCRLFKKGYTMTGIGRNKAGEIRQLKTEYNRLVDDYNHLATEDRGSITKIVRISKEMLNLNKKIRDIEDSFIEGKRE